jgi:hypothetical protein
MRQIFYAMVFEGKGEPAGEGVLRAATRSASTRLTSSIGAHGLESQRETVDGGVAEFTSEVRLTGDTSFTETGMIRFGNGHSIEFSTIGEGYIAPSPEDGIQHGAVDWRIDGGTGQFEGASGIVTSNFTLSADGAVTDRQYGVIWVR